MEPLLRNIEANGNIDQIQTRKLGLLPKAYSYADDLSCVTRNSAGCLQGIFDEYSRLTKLAGLELNAEKTELMRFASELRGRIARTEIFDVTYLGNLYRIETVLETKINGILFQQDEHRMKNRNVDQVKVKMEKQLRRWAQRSLTTLGKILIVKTFGISQAIFLMQSLTLDKSHLKLLNETLYKFIWNRHFQAAKAPERVKREIVNISLKRGGFGMLDISVLDNGLKLRAVGRLLSTEHPGLKLVKEKLDLSDFFFPKIDKDIDNFTWQGLGLLGQDRQNLWDNPSLLTDTKYISAMRACKIRNLIKPQFRNNLTIFMWHRAGKLRVEHLDRGNLNTLGVMLADRRTLRSLEAAVALRVPIYNEEASCLHYINRRWENLGKIASKAFRENRSDSDPLCVYKCGLVVNPGLCQIWLRTLYSLKSTAHKNAMLRLMHGDIYSKERLYRFGMSDSPMCDYCGELETIDHKIWECAQLRSLWKELAVLTKRDNMPLDLDFVAGAFEGCERIELTLHAELITRLIRNSRTDQPPSSYVKALARALLKKEKGEGKTELESLLV